MKKLIAFLLICVLHILASMILPWWNLVLVAIITVLIFKFDKKTSFYLPFLAIALLWLGWIYLLDKPTHFYQSERIAALFEQDGLLAYLIPVLFGSLIAGLSGLAATLFKESFTKKDESLIQESMSINDYKETQPDLGDKEII